MQLAVNHRSHGGESHVESVEGRVMVDEDEARRTDREGEDDRHQDEKETARLAGHRRDGGRAAWMPWVRETWAHDTWTTTHGPRYMDHPTSSIAEGLIHWTRSGSFPTFK